MAKRPPMSLVPRNRIWDLEYDIYCHLQNKNKVLASSETDEKFNYFSSLLEEFHVPDTNNTSQEHAQFMDGLYCTVSTQMHHLPQPEHDTAEAEEEEEDNDDVVEDPLYKLFMDHLRPDGKFYALEITEGTRIFVRYHHEPSSSEEALALCVTENANHASNDEMHAEYKKGKSRGRKPKGSNNGSGKNGVASSEPQNHDHDDDDGNKNNNKKRKRGRPRKNEACIDKTQGTNTIDHNRANDDGIPTEVKEEIEDYEHVHEPVVNKNVEYFWHDEKGNARKVSEYREKLLKELEKPYCEEEYERLLKEIACRKPVQHHKELRNGRGVTFEEDYLGKSFLDHNIDLSRKIDEFGDDHPRVLNLLRGFFFWLKNCSDEYAFMPWRDSLYYLDVVPQLRK